MQFNINDQAMVTLTEHGMKILKASSWFSIHVDLKMAPSGLNGAVLRMELWSLMNIFGRHLYNGYQNSFVDNHIDIGPSS